MTGRRRGPAGLPALLLPARPVTGWRRAFAGLPAWLLPARPALAPQRRVVGLLALLLLAGLTGSGVGPRESAAAVSSDVQTLRWRRPVVLPPGGSPGWYAIVEDSVLASGAAPEFTDMRLMDAAGQVRRTHREPLARRYVRRGTWREYPVQWVEIENAQREMLFDLGPDAPPLLSVELTGYSSGTFFRAMGRDSASGDWVQLAVAHDVEPVYDPMKPPEPSSRLDLGEVRRYLRLLSDSGGTPPGTEDRVRLFTRQVSWPARQAVGFRAMDARFAGAGRDEWTVTLELTGPARTLTRVNLRRLGSDRSSRSIRVESRVSGSGWRWVSIEHGPGTEAAGADSLILEPVRTTALRLTVSGADAPNAPYEVTGVEATPQRWIVRLDAIEPLWVGYGDPYLVTPAAEGPAAPSDSDIQVAGLGPAEANPFHREPGFGLEWLKRRPEVLGVVMVALLALVAWLALGRRGSRTA